METDGSVKFAGVVFDHGFPIDRLLNDVAAALERGGAKLAGVMQTSEPAAGCDVSSVRLRSLARDWDIPILQERGSGATGCRLDYASIVEASSRIAADIPTDSDFVFLNRFGRAEAEGNGFRDILQKCLEDDIPVIIGVRRDYLEAWDAFHGGFAVDLPCDKTAILDWCKQRSGHFADQPVMQPKPVQ
jgi:hypothetical protein